MLTADRICVLIPGLPRRAGGTQRLTRTVGIPTAKRLIFTGEELNAAKALALGVVDYADPDGEAVPLAITVARQMLDKGTDRDCDEFRRVRH